MKVKKYIALIFVGILLGTGIYAYNNHNTQSTLQSYTYTTYYSKEEIIDASDVIIKGVIKNNTIQKIDINLDPNSQPILVEYKVSDVLVTQVLKGNVEVGDTVKVKYPATDKDNLYVTLDEKFSKDNECILLLDSYTDVDHNIPYSLISPRQGAITLNNIDNLNFNKDDYDLFYNISKNKLDDYILDQVNN